MHITRLDVKNIRGIEHVVLDMNHWVCLTGKNGTGKSSLLQAIRIIFDGGFEDDWIRYGETEASIVADISDGSKVTIELKRPNEKRKKYQRNVEIVSPEGVPMKREQEYLNSLATGLAYDPTRFLTIDKKGRADYITKFLPVTVEPWELRTAAGGDWYLEVYDPKAGAFDNIAAIRTRAYDKRTELNRRFKNLDGATNTLRREIPSLGEDRAELDAREAAAATKLSDYKAARQTALAQVEEESKAAMERIDSWEEIEIQKIRTEAANQRSACGKAKAAAIQQVQQEWDTQVTEASEEHAAAREALAAYNKAIGSRDQVTRWEHELRQIDTEIQHLEKAMQQLDKLKQAKLESSPIPGVELREGEIFIDGIPFDAVNLARRIDVAIQIAAQNPGKLPLMLLDDAEHLSQDNWEAFKQAAMESGFQIISARVDNQPLSVETR